MSTRKPRKQSATEIGKEILRLLKKAGSKALLHEWIEKADDIHESKRGRSIIHKDDAILPLLEFCCRIEALNQGRARFRVAKDFGGASLDGMKLVGPDWAYFVIDVY